MQDLHFNFAALLTLAALITGVIYAIDALFFARQRREAGEERGNALVEFARSFFPVILVVLLLRSFLVEPFRIPSGSMIPSLLVGDFILVNKYTYGLRTPVGYLRFVEGRKPERGEVVVFRYPVDTSKDFIKRVVGLPGDRIVYRDKQLRVNGELVEQRPDGVFAVPGLPGGVVERYTETVGDHQYSIIINPMAAARDFDFTVPEGEYFMMGDNRDGSDDSRRWGSVPERNLVGRAFFIWMSWDGSRNRPDWGRIGNSIE
jgi:signal peptidase I